MNRAEILYEDTQRARDMHRRAQAAESMACKALRHGRAYAIRQGESQYWEAFHRHSDEARHASMSNKLLRAYERAESAERERDEARAELAAERARREASDAEAARLLRACHYNQAWAGHMADRAERIRAEARRWKRAAWAMRVEAEVYRRWWLESESVDRFTDEAIARADAAEARARGLREALGDLCEDAERSLPSKGLGATLPPPLPAPVSTLREIVRRVQAALAAAEAP
jgi:hypothetical protein